MMKVCFIGLGSIGTRHLSNLKKICLETGETLVTDVLSSSRNRIYEGIDQVYYSYSDLPNDYDIIFITNPTLLHLEAIEKTRDKARYYFLEKPVFSKWISDLNYYYEENKYRYYVACPLRYTNVIQYIKQNFSSENIICVRSICSSYLPEWRPNMDYRKVYSARRELGGGVVLDLIHEMDYMTYLLGKPANVIGQAGRVSSLEIDTEDIAEYILRYKHTYAEIHLDYFGRVPRREIEIYTNEDVIIGDLNHNCIKFLKSGELKSFGENINDRYVSELKYFLKLCKGMCENENDIIHANEITRIGESILVK